MDSLQKIEQSTGYKASACSCSTCKNMCKVCPCIGTPEDILKLIEAGQIDKLTPTKWLTGTLYGLQPINMVQIIYDNDRKACSFLTEENLCLLHNSGLKPTEGKLASCSNKKVVNTVQDSLPYKVAAEWENMENFPTIAKIFIKVAQHHARF